MDRRAAGPPRPRACGARRRRGHLALDARRLGRMPGTVIAYLMLAALIIVSAVWLAFTD